jgi:hypothetical protein
LLTRRHPVLFIAVALAAAAMFTSSAFALEPAGKVDLSKVTAKKEVKDAILEPGARVASTGRVVARTALADSQGQPITIDSTVGSFDLSQVAAVLNSTFHRAEITKVQFHVITLSGMATTCGDAQAIACSRPMSGGYGELWFAADDTDWIHSLVHEYGHHIDNQFANIGQLHSYGVGTSCTIDSDGTRNWFFERLGGSNTTDADRFSCLSGDWEHLVPELFAEDFVVLNGINGWQLSSARPPTNSQLQAMRFDFDNLIYTANRKYTKKIKRKRARWTRFKTPNWSVVKVKVTTGRGHDFNVAIFEKTSSRAYDIAASKGRKETLTTIVPPGTWDIGVYAAKKTGVAKVSIKIL